jgi:hypothetical protein
MIEEKRIAFSILSLEAEEPLSMPSKIREVIFTMFGSPSKSIEWKGRSSIWKGRFGISL